MEQQQQQQTPVLTTNHSFSLRTNPSTEPPSHSPWIRSDVDKVPRLRSVDVVVFQGGDARRGSSGLQCVFAGVTLHAPAGTLHKDCRIRS